MVKKNLVLVFSLLAVIIIAIVVFYSVITGQIGDIEVWRIVLSLFGGVILISLASLFIIKLIETIE